MRQDAETTEKRKAARELMAALNVDEEPEDGGLEVFDREVDEEALQKSVDGMNAGQKEVFDAILAHVAEDVSVLSAWSYS